MKNIKKESDKFSDSLIFEGMTSISALLNAQGQSYNDRRIRSVWVDASRTEKFLSGAVAESARTFGKDPVRKMGFQFQTVQHRQRGNALDRPRIPAGCHIRQTDCRSATHGGFRLL